MNSLPVNAPKTAEDLSPLILIKPTPDLPKTVEKLKTMQLKIVAPCHCTGDKALNILKKEFAKDFLINGVGAEYVFEI